MLGRGSSSQALIVRRGSTKVSLSPEAQAEYAAKAAVENQKTITLAVQDALRKLTNCLLELRLVQDTLMQKTQDFLARDVAAMDEPAMALLNESSAVFQVADEVLSGTGLAQVADGCQRTLDECNSLLDSYHKRLHARQVHEHYRTKVTNLESQRASQDKLARNQGKLDNATRALDEFKTDCETQMQAFEARRQVHSRATLHAFLRAYLRITTSLGTAAAEVSQKYASEFLPGKQAEIVGLHRAKDLNGSIVTVEERIDSTAPGSRIIRTQSGAQKSIREENLKPVTASTGASQPAQKSVDGQGQRGQDSTEPEPVSPCSIKNGSSRAPLGDGSQHQEAESIMEVRPGMSPRVGGIEMELECPGLVGAIAEVVIGGVQAEILEVSGRFAKVRSPASFECGRKDIEVRAHGYERFVAKAPAAFQYYEPVRFGKCGRNIELQDAPQGPGIIAHRKDGLLHGVALTASPLLDLPEEARLGDKKGPQYYFEVDVREPTQASKSRTLFLGFAWPAKQATENAAADFGTLPEVSSEMGRSIVIGGDLPKVFVDGKEIAKVRGWRPLKDVGPGSLVGVLLALVNAAENKWQFSVYQDADHRHSCEVTLPASWLERAPHGLADVCGAVACVKLRQNALPPLPPDEAFSESEGEEQEPAGE